MIKEVVNQEDIIILNMYDLIRKFKNFMKKYWQNKSGQ